MPIASRNADFYEELFADIHLRRKDQAALSKTVDFLIRHLHLKPGQTVFDQCCGVGDISLALGAQSIRTIGVDLVSSYVEKANQRAQEEKRDCVFHAGDARDFASPDLCDAAFNWWTSFGYYTDDRENGKMIARVFESLKPGGMFVLDYMNTARYLDGFAAKGTITNRFETREGMSVWNSSLDAEKRMVLKTWSLIDNGGRQTVIREEAYRLYTSEELAELLKQSGFTGIQFFGDINGAPYWPDSYRCIALTQKPA